MRLNIGCSTRKVKGFINCDIDPAVKPDRVCDIEHLPFKTSSVDEVLLMSILEHVDLFNALKEVHRVCKNGATVIISMPHWTGGFSVYAHIQHRRGGSAFMFTEGKEKEYGFHYRVKEMRILKEGRSYPPNVHGGHPNGKTRWSIPFMFIEELINAFPNSFERLWYPLVGGAESIYFKLEVIK